MRLISTMNLRQFNAKNPSVILPIFYNLHHLLDVCKLFNVSIIRSILLLGVRSWSVDVVLHGVFDQLDSCLQSQFCQDVSFMRFNGAWTDIQLLTNLLV